mgnify:CR=1 FL=1
MRDPAHEHEIERGIREHLRLCLRDIGNAARSLRAGERTDVLAAEKNTPALRRQKAKQRAKEGRLPAAVRPKEAHDFASTDRQRRVTSNRMLGISKCESFGLDAHHDHPWRPRQSSQRKNGAPTTAVRMPIGTSMRAIERARTSTSTR